MKPTNLKRPFFALSSKPMKNIFTISLVVILLSGTIIIPNSIVFAQEKKIPNWVRNVVKWWGDGQVSDDEFIKGMKFLVQSKIIDIELPNSSAAIAKMINGPPTIQTDKINYNSGDEVKITGSGFDQGDVIIVIGNFEYLSLLDNYSKSLDWSQTDFGEMGVLMQYQYSDNGTGEWQKKSFPSGLAISTKIQADANGSWQTTLKNYHAFEKDATGNMVDKQNLLPSDQYIIKAAQKTYNSGDLSDAGYKTLSIKTAYSYITIQ